MVDETELSFVNCVMSCENVFVPEVVKYAMLLLITLTIFPPFDIAIVLSEG